eukprot:CAMPEP_0197076152 /NCGR_PEP_ID=MMETSP1384-20130603/211968_1 /TAXON_ID=29189 /ORGANISM="Ammonia sp." /LENGTH=166 /DNA_ID=CAMNT_0042515001 /DNA_START=30 /DNA_END=530 /DNA_ORIENTATION=+
MYSKTVISEKEYKPLHDKHGRDRCNQWEVLDREKLAVQEAGQITNIIKAYSGLRRISQVLPLKNWVKAHVIVYRREEKTVKWSSTVEVFEEKFVNEHEEQMVVDYRLRSIVSAATNACAQRTELGNLRQDELGHIEVMQRIEDLNQIDLSQGIINLSTTNITISIT